MRIYKIGDKIYLPPDGIDFPGGQCEIVEIQTLEKFGTFIRVKEYPVCQFNLKMLLKNV